MPLADGMSRRRVGGGQPVGGPGAPGRAARRLLSLSTVTTTPGPLTRILAESNPGSQQGVEGKYGRPRKGVHRQNAGRRP
jgi:hypothetical protein